MENNAIYDRIEDLMAKANDIKLAVDAIQTDVTEFGDMLGDIQAFTNETNVVVKDILNGRQISEWIADLETSGTASATYADSDRMNALIADTDACKNVKIAQILLNWSVNQNKANTFFGSALGDVSGVTWDSLASVNAIMANSAALTKIANDKTVFDAVMNNSECKLGIWNNASTAESIFSESSIAQNIFTKHKESVEIYDAWEDRVSKPLTKNAYLLGVYFRYGDTHYDLSIIINKPSGGSSTLTKRPNDGETISVKQFMTKVTVQPENDDRSVRADAIYVDFS